MNKQELSEIKRRMNADKGNIRAILGCYVSAKGEIISTFNNPIVSIPAEEATRYFSLFRRVLSGVPGKTQLDAVFTPDAVAHGDEHALLTALAGSALADESAVQALYRKIIGSLSMEDNYLILLAHDTYDVQIKRRGERGDAPGGVFSYFVCCVCPVKLSKPALRYFAPGRDFRESEPEWVVGAPELGMMFPAFDDRSANIYNALYYARDPDNAHPELSEAIFGAEMPLPAAVQCETFHAVLKEALEDDLRFDAVQAVHAHLLDSIACAQEDKSADAPVFCALDVARALAESGVQKEHIEAFETRYEQAFGRGVTLNAASIVDAKKFEVRTENVVISAAPDCSDLVEARVIDGKRYLCVRAEGSVQVNGVEVP